MESTTYETGPVTRDDAVRSVAINARTAVDIWLDANIKVLSMAEYRLYRDYLTPRTNLVAGGVLVKMK